MTNLFFTISSQDIYEISILSNIKHPSLCNFSYSIDKKLIICYECYHNINIRYYINQTYSCNYISLDIMKIYLKQLIELILYLTSFEYPYIYKFIDPDTVYIFNDKCHISSYIESLLFKKYSNYIAPEILYNSKPTITSDIYSIGMIFIELFYTNFLETDLSPELQFFKEILDKMTRIEGRIDAKTIMEMLK